MQSAPCTKVSSPIPEAPGSADVFQALSGLAVVHGLDYRPRPVFQSYAAYTPTLAKYNADFLKSDRAPQFVHALTGKLVARDRAPQASASGT